MQVDCAFDSILSYRPSSVSINVEKFKRFGVVTWSWLVYKSQGGVLVLSFELMNDIFTYLIAKVIFKWMLIYHLTFTYQKKTYQKKGNIQVI